MADFSAAQSDVLTTARDAGTVNVPVVQEGYRLIASGDHADLFLGQIESFGVEGLADPMGQSQIAAVEILDSTEECVLFLADVDESSLLADPSQAFTYDGPWHIQILRAPLAGARDWPWELSFRFFLEDPAPQTCAEMDELRPGFS